MGTLQNSSILFQERSYPRYHMLLWWNLSSNDAVGNAGYDSAILWTRVFVWTILSNYFAIDAGHAHYWRLSQTTICRRLFCKLWRGQQPTSARVTMIGDNSNKNSNNFTIYSTLSVSMIMLYSNKSVTVFS